MRKYQLIFLLLLIPFFSFQVEKSYFFKLGNKNCKIIHHEKGNVIAHIVSLHGSESTGVQAYQALKDIPGFDLFEISQSGNRLLEYEFKKQSFYFDPNRIFSRNGIIKTLEKYNPKFPEKIISEISILSDTIINLLRRNNSSKYIIAIHNNTNNSFSVYTYRNSKDATEVYINPKEDADDFYIVTIKNDFDFFKLKKFNVVLQKKNVSIDGSLSIFCQDNKIPYINIEAQNGHKEKQMQMIKESYYLLINK